MVTAHTQTMGIHPIVFPPGLSCHFQVMTKRLQGSLRMNRTDQMRGVSIVDACQAEGQYTARWPSCKSAGSFPPSGIIGSMGHKPPSVAVRLKILKNQLLR